MTLPDERYRAVKITEELLKDLCNPAKTPRVPKTIRQRAAGALRHYPTAWDMARAATIAPEIFQERMEPLYRMIKQYEEGKTNEA